MPVTFDAAENEPMRRRPWYSGSCSRCSQVLEVHAAIGGEVHLDDRREALPPGDFVAVMLVGPDEHHRLPRLLEATELLELRVAHEGAQLVAHHLARGRRQRDAEDLLQLVDRAGRARAAGHDAPVRAGVHGALDGALRFVQQAAHAAARQVVFRVRVGVDALQVLQVALDEQQAAARRRVIAIDHQPAAERRLERRIDADDLGAQEIEGQGRVHGVILAVRAADGAW